MIKLQPEEYAHIKNPDGLEQVWKDDNFLVQIFEKKDGATRLSINRIQLADNNHWVDGISWDELQLIKKQVGFGNFDAIEIYPKEKDVVNVANIRHLWVLDKPCQYAWRK